jgi:hypothetical protein
MRGSDGGSPARRTDLHGFSLAKAFGTQAIPALVAASQPNMSGGLASFGSIRVSTVAGR